MMSFDDIAVRAYFNKKLDDYCSLPEKLAYLRLKDLYFKYSSGRIGEIDGNEEKRLIKKEFEEDIIKYDRISGIFEEYNENKRIVTNKMAELEKLENKDEILKKALEVISILVKDDWLVERILNKLTKEI